MPEYTGEVTHVEFANVPLWLIALLPFIGAAINALFGRKLQASDWQKGLKKRLHIGSPAVTAVAVGAMLGAFAITVVSVAQLIALPAGERYLFSFAWQMVRIGSLDLNFAFSMDPLSGLMTLIITGVGTLIHVYAASYMEKEPSYWRFFCYLNLFVFSMLLLVLGDNFIVMFFGWEGVGLCSYLLIGFWYKDYKKASAGMKAFVVNRIGDWGFVIGMALLFWGLGGAWILQNGDYLPDFNARFVAVEAQPLAHGGDHGGGHEAADGEEHGRLPDLPAGTPVKTAGFAQGHDDHAGHDHAGHGHAGHGQDGHGQDGHGQDGHGHAGHGHDGHGHDGAGHEHGSGQGQGRGTGQGQGTGEGRERLPLPPVGPSDPSALRAGGTGMVTMTTHPGARVYFGVQTLEQLERLNELPDCRTLPEWNATSGAQLSTRCYATSPFVRKRVQAALHTVAVVPGDGAVVTGTGDEVAALRFEVKKDRETLIAPVGPTLTFREIHDQLVMVDRDARVELDGRASEQGHVLSVPRQHFLPEGHGALKDRVYTIRGAADHDHAVQLTAAQLSAVAAGKTVEVSSTPGGADNHTHSIVVRRPAVLKDALANKTVWGIGLITLVCLAFFVGATGKSAQIPLYVWLPDAMAGPTPVSALIHAATMVTAGVYMITRMNFLYGMTPTASGVVALIGALTALFAATMGFFQYDIKKVLAYSTVSQLGFMFIGVGVGAYWAGVFHLMTHAFFKACLFLGSGSVIHGMHHVVHDEVGSQDMRNMGGLRAVMPVTAKTYFIACLAITAAPVPFFAGFWSKDEILWKAFNSQHLGFVPGWLIFFIGLVAALGTSFYMWRSYFLTFEGKHAIREIGTKVHESPKAMTSVLAVLAFLSAFAGVVFGLSAHFFHSDLGGLLPHEPLLEQWLHPVTAHNDAVIGDAGYGVMILLMVISVVGAIGAWGLARLRYGADRPKDWAEIEQRLPGFQLMHNKYFVDEIYQATVVKGFMRLRLVLAEMDRWIVDGIVNGVSVMARGASWLSGAIDRYVVDGVVNFVADGTLKAGHQLRTMQTGRIQNYVYGILGGVAFLAIIQYFLG